MKKQSLVDQIQDVLDEVRSDPNMKFFNCTNDAIVADKVFPLIAKHMYFSDAKGGDLFSTWKRKK